MIKAVLRKSHKKYGLNKRPYLQAVAVYRGPFRQMDAQVKTEPKVSHILTYTQLMVLAGVTQTS